MLPLEPGNQRGTGQGKIKTIHRLNLRLYQSLGGKIRIDGKNPVPIKYKTDNLNQDESPALFSGFTPWIEPQGSVTSDGSIEYENDQPVPTTIMSVNPEYKVNP